MTYLILSFLIAIALTPLTFVLARRYGWIAEPRQDRWHLAPTALLGGIGIFGASALTLLTVGPPPGALPIIVGSLIMFGTGLVDDLHHIRPATKLVGQVVATGILVVGGYTFGVGWPVWVSIPLTFLWVIGLTNSLNLLDNMDGLAVGIATIAAASLGVYCALSGNMLGLGLSLVLVGATAGFLFYNTSPAKVFMGDCGSLFLGYTIAALALVAQQSGPIEDVLSAFLVPVAVMAVPIFDTTLVTAVRLLTGRRVSQGGRDHTSHRLVLLGLSERWAVLTLWMISMACGALAVLFQLIRSPLFYALTGILFISLLVLGVFLGRVDVYKPRDDGTLGAIRIDDASPLKRLVSIPYFLFGSSWKVFFFLIADIVLLTSAMTLAHYLRFEQGLTPERLALLADYLPMNIVIKITVFYAFRLYSGIWEYAGTPELMRISGANVVASMLVFLASALWVGPNAISKGAFFIDWMLATITTAGVRLGFRGLKQHLAAQSRRGIRIVLYGAGDAGTLALREIRQNIALHRTVVGLLDDSPQKQGRIVQGLEVLGALDDLQNLIPKHSIEEVVLSSFRMPEDRQKEIIEECRRLGIRCSTFSVGVQSIHDGTSSE